MMAYKNNNTDNIEWGPGVLRSLLRYSAAPTIRLGFWGIYVYVICIYVYIHTHYGGITM